MISFRGRNIQSWRSHDYCSIDVETTGLDLQNDEVISVGAVLIVDGRFKGHGNFYEEIVPAKNPSPASIEVHGIRGVDLASAKPAESVIPLLIDFMKDTQLIAHANWVEKAFLSHRMKKYGYKYPKRVIDTAALARYAGIAENKNGYEPSLEVVARKLNLPVYSPHHALGDAMTTAGVFLALASRIEAKIRVETGQELSLERLHEISTR